MQQYNQNNELYHYGVLGMRWGVKRARRNLVKADRLRSRGMTEKANRLEARAKAKLQKHNRYSGGSATVDYTMKQSLGKQLAKSYLFGTYGALKYNEARAKGASRGKAAVNAILYNTGNIASGGGMSILEPRVR